MNKEDTVKSIKTNVNFPDDWFDKPDKFEKKDFLPEVLNTKPPAFTKHG